MDSCKSNKPKLNKDKVKNVLKIVNKRKKLIINLNNLNQCNK